MARTGMLRLLSVVGLIAVMPFTAILHSLVSSRGNNVAVSHDHAHDAPQIILKKKIAMNETTDNTRHGNATAHNSTCPSLSAALVLFGVPKSFEYIWKAYLRNIVQRNPHVSFQAHMHMYSDLHQQPFTNNRSDEVNVTLQSPQDIQNILHNFGGISTKLVTSSQSKFDESELSWMQEVDTVHFKNIHFESLKNVFRQGNSLKQAYLSASLKSHLDNIDIDIDITSFGSSQLLPSNETIVKRENQQQQQKQPRFDIYIFARSDTLLLSPIDIPCSSGLGDREIHLPPMNWMDNWNERGFRSEVNDRFAMSGPIAANVYAAAKSDVFKKMILDQRSQATTSIKKMWTLRNPEKMLMQWLEDADNHLEVKRVPNEWAKLLRVRAGGIIDFRDRKRFGIDKQLNVQDVKLLDQ